MLVGETLRGRARRVDIELVDRPVRALIVDNEPGDVWHFTTVCKKSFENLEIKDVRSLNDGVKAIEKGHFDIIFVDLKLPDGMGAECVEVIKAVAPNIPVIAMSGLATGFTKEVCKRAGAAGFMFKHEVNGETLLRCMSFLGLGIKEIPKQKIISVKAQQ